MIRKWIIPITGFTQDIDKPNGFDRLWSKLRAFVNPQTSLVTPQRWRAKFDHIAEFIFRHSQNGDGFKRPTIIVPAYSWGCGHGAKTLFHELGKRGLAVDHAVLCDPVYHSWTRPWRAMFFSPEILIPPNVREVHWLRQRQNRPQGTELVAEDETATTIHKPEVVARNHEFMDDAPSFHAKVLEVAKR